MASRSKSFWRKLWHGFLWLLALSLLGGAFVAGRISTRPNVTSLLPTSTATPAPNAPPEQIIQAFFAALIQKDLPGVLNLCHPQLSEYKKKVFIEYIKGEKSPEMSYMAVEIISTELDESAKILITYTMKDRHQQPETKPGTVTLKKYQGQWRILDL